MYWCWFAWWRGVPWSVQCASLQGTSYPFTIYLFKEIGFPSASPEICTTSVPPLTSSLTAYVFRTSSIPIEKINTLQSIGFHCLKFYYLFSVFTTKIVQFCLFCFIFPVGFHWILWMDGFGLLGYRMLAERRICLWWILISSIFSIPFWKNGNSITSARTWSRMKTIWKPQRNAHVP